MNMKTIKILISIWLLYLCFILIENASIEQLKFIVWTILSFWVILYWATLFEPKKTNFTRFN